MSVPFGMGAAAKRPSLSAQKLKDVLPVGSHPPEVAHSTACSKAPHGHCFTVLTALACM